MGKQLNIKRVSEVIGTDYKRWRVGDIIKIKAQTGAGKTFFITGDITHKQLIDKLEDHEKMLYVCNRISLKRQVKIDILNKFNIEIKTLNDSGLDYEWLDNLQEIKNIRIISYHEIAEKVLDKIHFDKKFDLQDYNYIICDECHFFLTDASFNNKTYLAYEEIINRYYPNSIKIMISATMNEVDKYLNNSIKNINNSGWISNDINVIEYSTNFDYSYLDIKYFMKIKDIITLIKNDKTNEKWLIFITQSRIGENIEKELNEAGVTATFIKAGINNHESSSIIENSKFNSKVLITTKVMDNGVNIKDEDVRNLVVMAYDKVTFIQEIGRIRIDIKNAKNIKLYIPCLSKKSFIGKRNDYEKKKNEVKLFNGNYTAFKRKYSHDSGKNPLFYLDKNNEWKISELGLARLEEDIKFTNYMIEKFKIIPKYAYIFEQLSWLGLTDTFDESKMIQYVGDEINMRKLEEFLREAYENDERFTKEYFIVTAQEIIESDDALRVRFNNLDGGNKRSKGINKFNEFFKKLKLEYIIVNKVYKENVNGKRKNVTYYVVGKNEVS